jgi:hypothetical protein
MSVVVFNFGDCEQVFLEKINNNFVFFKLFGDELINCFGDNLINV